MTPLAAKVLDVLPQTQCTRCGYPDCAAYAQAIADGNADINQCPPGGAQGIERLAAITQQPVLALNPVHGVEDPRSIAFIIEESCIGCTLCLKACPTDAIMGSNKLMHTVIEAYCTGCELCLPVCPVDCIELENASGAATGWAAWSAKDAETARKRYQFHLCRSQSPAVEDNPGPDDKRAVIEAALTRARLQRESRNSAVQNPPPGRPKAD